MSGSGRNLSSLPPELLNYLFTFLCGDDLKRISIVCKNFLEAALVDSLWKRCCQVEYGVDTSYLQVDGCWQSSKEVYIKVLQKYGCLLGTWALERSHFGGLIHVVFENGTIIGREYQVPKIALLKRNLRVLHVHFKTVRSHDGTVDLRGCFNVHHDSAQEDHLIKLVSNNDSQGITLESECECKSAQAIIDTQYSRWAIDNFHIQEEEDLNSQHILNASFIWEKFQAITEVGERGRALLKKVVLPSTTVGNVPVQPGIFVGEYSAHGYEILYLDFTADRTELILTKITGDPNIPAGQISIKVDLSRPMVLTSGQQHFMANLREIDTADVLYPGGDSKKLPPQPFQVPNGCDRFIDEWAALHVPDSDNVELPNMCKARFHAKGHVAGHGFQNDQYIPAHWILFSEDLFCVLWLPFFNLSVFSRTALR